ncbi:MAG TPA: asparaginase [Candidatus Limnocylindria bacterium]
MARLLVEVTRGDRVESRHRGSIAVVSSSGELSWSFGDADGFAFIRSSAKPFQLAPFVASGRFDAYDFPNPTESLAIMAASHSGEDRHVRTVQAVLRAGGLTRDVLACGVHAPFDTETAQRLIRDGEPLTPLRHNCSGKHAAMALHAKAAGWPIETYWQPDHPVQQLALDTVSLMSGVARSEIVTATDGCGVVSFGLPLRGLALAFARLADPSSVPDPALRTAFERIRDAMMAHPELVGGDRRRLDTALMRAAPARLVAKTGAEGVQAVGVLAGSDESASAAGLAIKIEDGDSSNRARNVATCAALHQLGALGDQALERLSEYASPQILDPRGEAAGAVRPAFELVPG